MSLKMTIVCDAEGCKARLQTAFNPGATTAFNEAVMAQGWRVAVITRKHYCPDHASPWTE